MQEGHMIFYESQKLNEHEVNYVTHDLELNSIVIDLKMWRHYLLGRIIVLMIYHSGLRYLFDQPKLNVIQARWISLVSLILKSNISTERRIGWLMPLVEL
jgi:hypothetical protein